MRQLIFTSAIDALKICVTGNDLWNHLLNEDVYYFDGGIVKVYERISDIKGETREILSHVYIDGLDYIFAELQLSNDKYSFMSICNKAFYDVLTCDRVEKSPMVTIVQNLLPSLGLTLLHVTKVDVCLDVNCSALCRLKKAIKNTQELALIINGKRVPNEAASIRYLFQANRYRLLGQPTVYFKSTGGLALTVYDKGRELAQASSSKNDYIREWSGIKGQTLHRVELSIKGNRIAKFCMANHLTQDDFLDGILHHEFRMKLLGLIDDVLRFNQLNAVKKKKSDTVSVLDVVLGRCNI